MDKIRIAFILVLTVIIIIGTTCLAVTGIVNAPSGLVLREAPSKGANPITTVSDESKVEIIEKMGDWYKVKYGNYEGYLFAEYVKAEEIPEPTPIESTDENTQEENQDEAVTNNQQNVEERVYPKTLIANTNIKGYLIPSITSKVILNIEQDKTLTLNYELGNWLNISYEGKQAWIRKYYINMNDTVTETTEVVEVLETAENTETNNLTEPKSTNTDEALESRKGYINVNSSANVRESASTSASIITTLLRNAEVTITAENGDFYKIQYQNITGYVSKSLISNNPVEVTSRSNLAERRNTETEESNNSEEDTIVDNSESVINDEEQVENVAVNSSSAGANIANYAKQYIGYNYVYGGSSPSKGFDCSGFAQYVYSACGYTIGRTCTNQLGYGTSVSRDELKEGDLVFFNNTGDGSVGHVGIYIGNGNMVHAANSRKGVITETIESGYYDKYYYTARRIVD